jgi:hypothetical protein
MLSSITLHHPSRQGQKIQKTQLLLIDGNTANYAKKSLYWWGKEIRHTDATIWTRRYKDQNSAYVMDDQLHRKKMPSEMLRGLKSVLFKWVCQISYQLLTFNERMGQHHPIKCRTLSSERENTIPWWALQLNSGLTAAGTWHLKRCMLKVKAKANHFIAYLKIKNNVYVLKGGYTVWDLYQKQRKGFSMPSAKPVIQWNYFINHL